MIFHYSIIITSKGMKKRALCPLSGVHLTIKPLFLFFRQVLWLTMWCLLFVVNGGQVVAQSSPLYADQSYLYTPVRLSHGDLERTVRALIDTGCSFCVIDSTFAIDSCGWDRAALAPLHTRAASGARVPVHSGVLGVWTFAARLLLP